MISINEFKRLEIRIGEIKSAERVPGTDKLLRLVVDLGETKPRQIIAGIALFFPETSVLIGKKCAFAANLETRLIRNLESQGMILAVGGVGEPFSLLEVSPEVRAGSMVK
jgi:methionyl-tRNA synthetase